MFKLDTRIPSCTVFVPQNAGIYYGSQTVEVDTTLDRLLVFRWADGWIRAVSLSDLSDVSNASPQVISQIQSSEKGPDGEIYVSSYLNNGIYRYEPDLTGDPVLISSNHQAPSGLAYHPTYHFLFVCSYGGDRIDTVPLIPSGFPEKERNPRMITVYPNLVTGSFLMECFSGFPVESSLRLLDLRGLLVYWKTLDQAGLPITESMDISVLPAGIYFLQLWRQGIPVALDRIIKVR